MSLTTRKLPGQTEVGFLCINTNTLYVKKREQLIKLLPFFFVLWCNAPVVEFGRHDSFKHYCLCAWEFESLQEYNYIPEWWNVDTPDLESGTERCGGSNPPLGTKWQCCRVVQSGRLQIALSGVRIPPLSQISLRGQTGKVASFKPKSCLSSNLSGGTKFVW